MNAASSTTIPLDHDLVVVGGGLAGIRAAVAAGRLGARTALVHDRPLLGGNASGELRIHTAGADCSGHAIARYVRESGVIDELRVENLRRNDADSPDVFSLICRELVEATPNVELFMNTRVRGVTMAGADRIESVIADQATTEKVFAFRAALFIDCTGDGFIGARAGASFRIGREGQDEFGEQLASPVGDGKTLPSCVEFYLKDLGRPTPFTPPVWARRYETDADLPFRDTGRESWQFGNLCGGFWWLSAGGDRDTIADNEAIYRELLAVLLGIWDHMKNRGEHGAANFALDWISPIPGKRESRRLEGDHWLREADLLSARRFDDRVAYGGWPIDLHPPEGVFSKDPPNLSVPLARPYTIPLRCLYSKNVANLLFAGRDASFSHVALGSARVMATCAVAGQAAGTAAAMCVRHRCSPRELAAKRIIEVQQTLLREGASIPDCPAPDAADLARAATVRTSGHAELAIEESPQDSQAIETRLFQLFPLTGPRLDRVELLVETAGPSTFRTGLRCADDIWDFSSTDDLATTGAATDRAGEQWIGLAFHLDNLPVGLYWLWVEADGPGAKWLGRHDAPLGTVRGRWQPRRCARPQLAPPYDTLRGTFIYRLVPACRPYGPENVISGTARIERWTNAWVSPPLREGPAWLELAWPAPVTLARVQLAFDGQYDANLTWPPPLGIRGCVNIPSVIKRYELQARRAGTWTTLAAETDNYHPRRVHRFDPVATDALRLVMHETHSVPEARVFEIRAYGR